MRRRGVALIAALEVVGGFAGLAIASQLTDSGARTERGSVRPIGCICGLDRRPARSLGRHAPALLRAGHQELPTGGSVSRGGVASGCRPHGASANRAGPALRAPHPPFSAGS
jgi:hypothetical protein